MLLYSQGLRFLMLIAAAGYSWLFFSETPARICNTATATFSWLIGILDD